MKAREFFEELIQGADKPEVTCDTLKSGDSEREIKKVALSMFATVDTVKRAAEEGVDLLLVHEPTYYNHYDNLSNDPVVQAKKALIEESGMIIYRYHDCMHYRPVDQVTEGELRYLGITGKVEKTKYNASYILTMDEPITALEAAERMEKGLGIKHIRIAGAKDRKAKTVAACFGTPGGVFDLLRDERIEMVMVGEACEWQICEYARDAAALGYNKSMLVMGHIPSERDGMRLLTERLQAKHPDLAISYLECGEVYSYTDC